MTTLRVKSAHGAYPVLIGCGALNQLSTQIAKTLDGGRLFVIYDANLFALHGARFRPALKHWKYRAELVIPSGERHKNAATLKGVYDFLLEQKVARDDLILACGGGVTSDLVGYAAATVLRGVRWGVVSTTLIGMADASIGGKTGINHRLGKNLVGAFWAPSFVVSAPEFLNTLPRRHLVAGLGEIIKCAGLSGTKEIARCERFLERGDWSPKVWEPLIQQAAAYKVAIVAADEHETGRRVLLNYGHTFAHAIEAATGFGKLLHGEAVLLGVLAALKLGGKLGLDGQGLRKYAALAERAVGWAPRRKLNADRILQAMAVDKKRQTADLKHVLLAAPGKPVVRGHIPPHRVREALMEMLRYYEAHGGKGDKDSRHTRTESESARRA